MIQADAPNSIKRRISPGEIVYLIRKTAVSAANIPDAHRIINRCRVQRETSSGVYVLPLDVEKDQRPCSKDGAFCARLNYLIFDDHAAALEYAAVMVSKVIVELADVQQRATSVLDELRDSLKHALLTD